MLAQASSRIMLTRSAQALCLLLCLSSCTYLKYASVQAEYARIQEAKPGQLVVKHLIDRETFFVYGRCDDKADRYTGVPKAIAAYSNKYKANERVDTMYFEVAGSHYGLNLPGGLYDLLVFADIDGNGTFEPSEVVGTTSIELDETSAPEKVLGQVNLQLGKPTTVEWDASINVPNLSGRTESLFYPAGTIRGLDDRVFDSSFSTLGMYDPASFLEQAPTMFYALEEDFGYKIPVVFVHGIAGSARDFESFVGELDRFRYKPWFFHYPSGGDLDQLAELFYQIFLSGKLHRSGGMPMIIVAHSMGGLIAREALNKYTGKPGETPVHLFVSMASPFGGHSAAAAGEEHGLIVLPSWRDLNPENGFINNLYRNSMPEFTHHELIYAYQNRSAVRFGENSDGVVALTSQLHPEAQRQANGQFGFDDTHTSILDSEEVAAHIQARMDLVENLFPPSHLELLRQGGYDVPLGEGYTPISEFVIRTMGKYLTALSNGTIAPFHPDQEHFLDVINGDKSPRHDAERGWLQFTEDYPEYRDY